MNDNDVTQLVTQYRQVHTNDDPIDMFLRFLREHGCSKVQSMKALISARGIGLAEAKNVVHESPTWADRRASDDIFHAELEDVLQKLADDDFPASPQQ